jgi:hypothetical protein
MPYKGRENPNLGFDKRALKRALREASAYYLAQYGAAEWIEDAFTEVMCEVWGQGRGRAARDGSERAQLG